MLFRIARRHLSTPRSLAPLCALFLFAFGSTAEGSAIAAFSYLDFGVNANAGAGDMWRGGQVSQIGTTNSLTGARFTAATNGTSNVQSFVSATATWSSASAGSVTFSDVGWISADTSQGGAVAYASWRYDFIATANGVFNLNWAISSDPRTTDPSGLDGSRFVFLYTGEPVEVLALDTSGVYTRPVTAGTYYAIVIANNSQLSGDLGTRTAFVDANFEWNITEAEPLAAPEPSTLSLLAIGLAVGVWRFRRLK